MQIQPWLVTGRSWSASAWAIAALYRLIAHMPLFAEWAAGASSQDSNVLVSAFTSLEGPSRQLSRIVLSGSAEVQIPVPRFAEYEASVSRPMIQQRCPLPHAEQTRLFDAFRSRTHSA